MGTDIQHPVPDRVKPSFVIFDFRALWRSALSARVPKCQKLQMTIWHRILYSCTHMAIVGVKGLTYWVSPFC